LSTLHDRSIVQTLKTDRDGNAISKPNVVLEYNKYMGASINLIRWLRDNFHEKDLEMVQEIF